MQIIGKQGSLLSARSQNSIRHDCPDILLHPSAPELVIVEEAMVKTYLWEKVGDIFDQLLGVFCQAHFLKSFKLLGFLLFLFVS